MSVLLSACGAHNVAQQPADQSEYSLQEVSTHLRTALDTIHATTFSRPEIIEEVKTFYRFNGYQLFWSDQHMPKRRVTTFFNMISQSEEHGLPTSIYPLDQWIAMVDHTYDLRRDAHLDALAHTDIVLTAAYIQYLYDLRYGMLDFSQLGEDWHQTITTTEVAPYLPSRTLEEAVSMLAPQSTQYKALQRKLADYQYIERIGGWHTLPDTMRVRPGGTHEAIHLLRDRLELTGDYHKLLNIKPMDYTYSEDLQDALKRFQARHGMQPTGVVDEQTIAALNVPVAERVQQLLNNLDRARLAPPVPDGKYVHVNIPEYRLHVYENGRHKFDLRAIVGKASSKTPVAEDFLTHIIFSPTWFVPSGRFNRQVLPIAKANPDYLETHGYKLYAKNDMKGGNPIDPAEVHWDELNYINEKYLVARPPYQGDAIKGDIMFAFDSESSIYIAEAQNTSLFSFSYRPFNSSSLSIDQPELLAAFLLDVNKRAINDLRYKMKLSSPQNATLPERVPVHLTYFTAWVDQDGVLQFREDVYGYDQRQAQLTDSRKLLTDY